MKISYFVKSALLVGALLCMSFHSIAQQRGGPAERSFTEITDGLYWVQNNRHYTVLLVTDEGAVLTDPINDEFSSWLKNEVKERWDVPVKYVVHSHHHSDHSSGGNVWKDTATIVAQEEMAGYVSGETPTHGNFDAVAMPEVTYRDAMTINIGDQTVEVSHLGFFDHANDMSVINFVEKEAIFFVDIVSVGRMPYKTVIAKPGPGAWDGFISAIKKMEAIDFKYAAPGHGLLGDKSDIVAYREYLEKTYDAVAAGVAAGKSLDEIKAEVTMDDYSDWLNYADWQELNVEGIYAQILAE